MMQEGKFIATSLTDEALSTYPHQFAIAAHNSDHDRQAIVEIRSS
jgi:hypothetical protein